MGKSKIMTEEPLASEDIKAEFETSPVMATPASSSDPKGYVVTWESSTPPDWQEQGIGMST